MHIITQSCILFLWIHTLTFVKSQDCTLQQFLQGDLYDSNFDTTGLETSYPGGKQVRVPCNVGHSGFFKLICVEGGWQSRGTKCQPRSCGHPGDAQFADFHLEKGDDFVFGSQVVYTCHKGYQMVSRTNFRRCMAEGWDGVVPICEAQQCPVIHVNNNVQVIGDPEEATYGNVIRFSCKSSSEVLEGSSEIYCNEYGDWSADPPICKEIKCIKPKIENGNVHGDIQVYKEDEILHFACNRGFKRAENIPSKCTKLGTRADWSPTPVCEPITCKLDLPPLYGTSYEPAFRNVFSAGETVTVTCGERFWISDPRKISVVTTCEENGEWSVRPVCQEVRCSNRREPNVYWWNVYWGQQISLGETVNYRCKEGYRSTDGTNQATCTRNGWSPDPLCQEITCDRLDVENANIQNYKQKYRLREQAHYVCKEGYEGEFSLSCGQYGWRERPYPCREITCHRQYFENADISGTPKHTYKYNDQVEYVCKNGFTGNFSITCKKIGWTGSRECTGKQCKKLDIKNADIVRNDKEMYNNGERVLYKCTYDNEMRFPIVCEQGVWNDIRSCPERPCEKLIISNADITHNERETYSDKEEVQYTCRKNEKRFTVVCNKGQWTDIKNCSECQKAIVPHGFVVGPYNDTDTVYYTCDEDYKLVTKGWWGEAKCIGGVWSGLQQCIAKSNCGGPPVIPNGKVISQHSNYKPDDSVQIICKEGYSPQVDRLTCLEGKWNSNGAQLRTICAPTAKICSPPPKVDNAVVVSSYQKEYLSGSEVTYRCRDNYTLEGEATITCNDGKWVKRNIVCALKPCELPDDTPNGYYQIIHGDDFVFGAVIKYFCNEGYQMVSKDNTRTCLLDKWTNHVPICDPLSCDPPPADEEITVKGLPENDDPILPDRFLTFSCDGPGKILNGSSVLICGIDGQWDNPFPTCEDISCKVGVLPAHLNAAGLSPANETVKVGHRLKFHCDNGYWLDGSKEIQCLQTGQWNAPFPTCSESCRVTGIPQNVNTIPRVPAYEQRKGQKLRFSCRLRGHVLHGKAQVECLENGQWSDPFPTCGPPLGCERPPHLPDGDTTERLKFKYSHDERVEYICQNYYIMQGGPFRTCNSGHWTGAIRCLKPCTVDRQLMTRHNIQFKYILGDDKLYLLHNDETEFICTRGRRHVGTYVMRQRCVDGVMNLPSCQ
ncbi:complement factor H isoform X6 [Lates calcarifer]|uniref:Complement factor H isoform X6 n=1 Tax=Lates calcarifer TaxID=8187 RepID=A0AAJ8DVH8_LATCA|nr:complement factor H isoform X6 [Lates calcarifer]